MRALPENLRTELDGWGYRSQRRGEGQLFVSDDGAELRYVDDYDATEYVLAKSDYDRAEVGERPGDPRPFLATVLDVLRWAAASEPDDIETTTPDTSPDNHSERLAQ